MTATTLEIIEAPEQHRQHPCDITYPTQGPCPQPASFEVLVNCEERSRAVRRLLCAYHLAKARRVNCLVHDRRHPVCIVAVNPL